MTETMATARQDIRSFGASAEVGTADPRLRAIAVQVAHDIESLVNAPPHADIESFVVERVILRGLLEARAASVATEAPQRLEKKEEA